MPRDDAGATRQQTLVHELAEPVLALGGQMKFQRKPRLRDAADAAPVRVGIAKLFAHAGFGAKIAEGANEFRVGIMQSRSGVDDLRQHRIECRQHGGRGETGNGGRYAVLLRSKTPFLGAHDGRDMAWSQ